MTLLASGSTNKFLLQPGETLNLTTDAGSTCTYFQASYPVAGNQDTPAPNGVGIVSVPASSQLTLGPQSVITRWVITQVSGMGVTAAQNAAQWVPSVGATPDTVHLHGNGAPTASTGQNHAATGSMYIDTANAQVYLQAGTKERSGVEASDASGMNMRG
jgi:hypothetical protein